MLPRSTNSRMNREATRGKQSGRTQEIQRLIGRSLRAIIDLKKLGERTIYIDCDVIQADGGTRTASISGAYVALSDAINFLLKDNKLSESPIIDSVAAISAGIKNKNLLLDLDYAEDSECDTDMNFVITGKGNFVEILSYLRSLKLPLIFLYFLIITIIRSKQFKLRVFHRL